MPNTGHTKGENMYMESLVRAEAAKAREPRECYSCGNKDVREIYKFYARGRAIVTCKYEKGCNA